MSDTESFEQVMAEMIGKVASPYWTGMADRLKAAHDREIRDVSQREFARGMDAGRHSMDAEHRAIAMRLRRLPLDGGSHENLSQIARAVYHSDWGWTQGACAALRDELVRLMGGVSDDTCGAGCCCTAADSDGDCGLQHEEVTDERFADDCAADSRGGDGGGDLHMAGVTYDVLWNERHKAVCELRNMHLDTGSAVKKLAIALGVKWNSYNAVRSVTLLQKRLIHLLGGDQPSGIDVLRAMDANGTSPNDNGTCPDDVTTASITDELREWASANTVKDMVLTTYPVQHGVHGILEQLIAIADRIDEQFDRICQQQEAVLQKTIEGMINERKRTFEAIDARAVKLAEQRNEARRVLIDRNAEYFKLLDEYGDMLDEYAEMEGERDNLLDLLRDARDEYKLLDRTSAETSVNFHAMRDRVWCLEAERDELRRKVDELENFDPETSIAAFGDDNGKLRRTLSRAATLLANAEQDRDANYAYWMDCKEKVVHANATIEELQAKLDAITAALNG